MELTKLTLGLYQTNCYIVRKEGSTHCCIIDPGYEAEKILSQVQTLGLTVDAVALTHGHFDHVGAVAEIAAETDCEVYISAADLSLPPMITNGRLYYTQTYPSTGSFSAAGLTFRVIPTPGHTPGSVCLVCEDVMFSGDTLFCGSCGRTDFPGSSPKDMMVSLCCLAVIEGNYNVYPGHDRITTLDFERKNNPFMRYAMEKFGRK